MKIGDLDFNGGYVGEASIDRCYVGDTLVWQRIMPASNEIWYTTTNGYPDTLFDWDAQQGAFGVNLISNTYRERGVAAFDGDITRISSFSMDGDRLLTSITLPSTVTALSVFWLIPYLVSMTCFATTPPQVSSGLFTDTPIQHIYVPAAAVDAYKAAEGWSDYASIIEAI